MTLDTQSGKADGDVLLHLGGLGDQELQQWAAMAALFKEVIKDFLEGSLKGKVRFRLTAAASMKDELERMAESVPAREGKPPHDNVLTVLFALQVLTEVRLRRHSP